VSLVRCLNTDLGMGTMKLRVYPSSSSELCEMSSSSTVLYAERRNVYLGTGMDNGHCLA
jgi:hypothetical protein